jgi:trk system potassium uptake protein TrkA
MYIVVVGGGKVGAQTARELVAFGHEVTVIERDASKVNDLNEELGEIAMLGDGTEVAIQEEAGVNRADLVVATTGRDEANLAVAQIAKKRFATNRVIARINFPKNEEIFQALGVDITVSATTAIMSQIEQALPSTPLIHLLELYGSPFELVEVVIGEDATTVGTLIRDLVLPEGALLPLVVHADGHPEVPTPETQLTAGAAVLAVTLPEHEAELRRGLTGGN